MQNALLHPRQSESSMTPMRKLKICKG